MQDRGCTVREREREKMHAQLHQTTKTQQRESSLHFQTQTTRWSTRVSRPPKSAWRATKSVGEMPWKSIVSGKVDFSKECCSPPWGTKSMHLTLQDANIRGQASAPRTFASEQSSAAEQGGNNLQGFTENDSSRGQTLAFTGTFVSSWLNSNDLSALSHSLAGATHEPPFARQLGSLSILPTRHLETTLSSQQ